MRTWLQHITHRLSDEQVLAGYDRVVELYPHVPSLSMWRAWEYAAYQGRTLDQPVLDVGCGDGRWFQLLWPEISDVYGIDMEPAVVERAIQSGVYRHVWQADAAAMPVDPGTFGTVFANCSLEHMDNIHTVMSNAWRALKPGGRFIFSVVTDKINDWFSPAALARALGEDALAHDLYDAWLRYHHLVNPFPIEDWCEGLIDAGFEVDEHIPIIPEMTGRLFLLIDGLWHTQQNAGEIGDKLHPYLQQVPNFPTAFRGILQSALMMESHPQIGCGAVLVARKVERSEQMIAKPERLCWCGESDMHPFSADYLVCTSCGTLASQVIRSAELMTVRDDQHDFYGKEYWLSHQRQDLGLPDIYARARADLPERCLYWLRTLLSFKQPPARVLELGGSHGGFVALLRWAGFDAIGTELSPWVVDFARQTFDVPMLLGDIDQQQLPAQSFDAVVLNDVLEHLPDPRGTLRHCAALLKPDGIMLIQTPSYPDPRTYQELVRGEERFVEMLEADEHLYLLSRRAVRQLFEQLGYAELRFLPALFDYDMYLVAGKQPLAALDPEEVAKNLSARPAGRMVQALLDKDEHFQGLARRYTESETDRAARQESIQTLERLLSDSEADRAARLHAIEQQGQQLVAIATERDDLQAQMADLQQLKQQLNQQATVIAEQQQQLNNLSDEHSHVQAEAQRFQAEAQRFQAEAQRFQADVAQLRSQWVMLEPALLGLRSSRIYRIARALGRFGQFDQALTLALPPDQLAQGQIQGRQPVAASQSKRELRRMVVDLTPVLPGGENGGAKLMTIELVKHLSMVAPECELILLTAERSHAELATLDAPNVRRLCVLPNSPTDGAVPALPTRLRRRLHIVLARVLPPPTLARLRNVYRWIFRQAQTSSNPLTALDIDIIFCPFTAPLYFDPTVPTIAVVYDLQHFYYPQFFSAAERSDRTRHFTELCRMATRLVCISEFVRGTVLENADIDPERVQVVHIQLPHRLASASNDAVANILPRFGVEQGQFLLYPANFWRHKNHDMLLTAFGMYCDRYPESQLKLICTGTPSVRMDELQRAADRMSLSDRVIFPGYLADHELAALLQACYAVIYPSLYEGFGMPLIEAMAFGKPVLCANAASLPEVAGDAALLFDPRKPDELVCAIEQIVHSPELATDLIQKGYRRIAAFADPAAMARQYLQIFREAVADVERFTDGVHGVYPDGWIGENVIVTFGASSQERQLELTLTAPDWIPHARLSTRIAQNGNDGIEAQSIDKGKTVTILHALPQSGGYIELLVDPVFQPKALGLNGDERGLGCLCQSCRIVSSGGVVDLL